MSNKFYFMFYIGSLGEGGKFIFFKDCLNRYGCYI